MRIIHPNTPKKLAKLLMELGSERAVCRKRKVNMLYVSQLVNKGIEPTDKTFKGREAREALFLPRFKRKPRELKPDEPEWLKKTKKGIRAMVKQTKGAMNAGTN